MREVIYNGDARYPGPKAHPPPDYISGIPTQDELDAYPRMFTWGELKRIVQSGELELLMRNKAMQHRYDKWMGGIKLRYGSTEKYLTQARLPWTSHTHPEPTYDLSSSLDNPSQTKNSNTANLDIPIQNLTSSTNPDFPPNEVGSISTIATPGAESSYGSTAPSGASTPSSAGFVSLASLKLVNGKLRSRSGRLTPKMTPLNGSTSSSNSGSPELGAQQSERSGQKGEEDDEDDDSEDGAPPVYLRFDKFKGLETDKYAVLPNDWPYNIPYGVRHYCVWSRVPIAHPELVDYSPDAWSDIESKGLGGFTGVTPLREFYLPSPPTEGDLNPSQLISSHDIAGRQKFIGELPDKDWYAADVAYAGKDMSQWAGVEYTSSGGQEVGKMVEGLWDPRGWECIWFVNPPRLQSVPGFSHYHVFARRKTPEEIDAGEAFYEFPK